MVWGPLATSRLSHRIVQGETVAIRPTCAEAGAVHVVGTVSTVKITLVTARLSFARALIGTTREMT